MTWDQGWQGQPEGTGEIQFLAQHWQLGFLSPKACLVIWHLRKEVLVTTPAGAARLHHPQTLT